MKGKADFNCARGIRASPSAVNQKMLITSRDNQSREDKEQKHFISSYEGLWTLEGTSGHICKRLSVFPNKTAPQGVFLLQSGSAQTPKELQMFSPEIKTICLKSASAQRPPESCFKKMIFLERWKRLSLDSI